jgi:LuxR family maltose regulon positive regulatory protein
MRHLGLLQRLLEAAESGGRISNPVVEPSKTQTLQSDLMEPLSERELEVVQLIAEGLTNPEIASRLYVALNTVKAHTRNIYGKLGVNNRTQAVARARAPGILTSENLVR